MKNNTDGNVSAIEKHLKEIDDKDMAFERFTNMFLDDIVIEINDLVDTASKLAKDFEGSDFREETEEFISDGVEIQKAER